MSVAYNEYLKTDYWQTVAKAVKHRGGYKCQVCNSGLDLVAHHRTYENRGNEMNHLDDLICLCRRCHEIFHGKQEPQNKPVAEHKRPQNEGIKITAAMESEMPPGNWPIKITKNHLEALRTPRGGWSSATMRALGAGWPVSGGWRKRLIGTTVSREDYARAIAGRFTAVKPR